MLLNTRIATSAIVLVCGFSPQTILPGVGHEAPDSEDCGWIGVQVRPMTPAFADSLGMVAPYGAIFDRPEPDSPAAGAGIQEGDVITAINGTRSTDFTATISEMALDSLITLTTSFRDIRLMEIKVVLGSCEMLFNST